MSTKQVKEIAEQCLRDTPSGRMEAPSATRKKSKLSARLARNKRTSQAHRQRQAWRRWPLNFAVGSTLRLLCGQHSYWWCWEVLAAVRIERRLR